MLKDNYSIDVISHLSDFSGKSLKKYNIDGISTVGAFGNEPFEIVFKNNTCQKVQVKISIDGTDVLTGELANTEVNDKMWMVNAYSSLNIKAWPETNNGGSQFVFTSGEKSVAVHTHGDLSHRGIIAAAVFTEGHVEPIRYHYTYYTYPYYIGGGLLNNQNLRTYDYNTITCKTKSFGESATYSSCSLNLSNSAQNSCEGTSVSNLAAVGSGDYVNQKITNVSGLIKPIFTETVRVRYMWWDELKNKLSQYNYDVPHPSGFPGDKPIMSIGNTPKISTKKATAMPTIEYSRV